MVIVNGDLFRSDEEESIATVLKILLFTIKSSFEKSLKMEEVVNAIVRKRNSIIYTFVPRKGRYPDRKPEKTFKVFIYAQ